MRHKLAAVLVYNQLRKQAGDAWPSDLEFSQRVVAHNTDNPYMGMSSEELEKLEPLINGLASTAKSKQTTNPNLQSASTIPAMPGMADTSVSNPAFNATLESAQKRK